VTSPNNRPRGYTKPEPKGEVRPCVDGGEKCPRGCGATLKTPNDRFMHVCDLKATSKGSMRGDRRSRSACA
jgi:hypothetical protein